MGVFDDIGNFFSHTLPNNFKKAANVIDDKVIKPIGHALNKASPTFKKIFHDIGGALERVYNDVEKRIPNPNKIIDKGTKLAAQGIKEAGDTAKSLGSDLTLPLTVGAGALALLILTRN